MQPQDSDPGRPFGDAPTNRTPGRRAAVVLQLAAAAGVITGGLQAVANGLRHVAGHGFIWLSADYVWMTPLGYLALFLALALVLAVASVVLPRLAAPRLVGFVFGTLGALSLVLLVPRLHHLAALAVAIGAGTRVAAWIGTGTTARLRALVRLAGSCAVLLAVVAGGRELAQRRSGRAMAAALPAATPGTPNVLVIILDTVRAASMSFLGYGRATTPALSAVGAEGVVFEQAYATAPWTLPSHAGMFTGRYPSQLSTDWRAPLDDANATLAEALRARGYRTAGFTANHFYTSYESGLARGFEHFEDYRRSVKQVLLSTTLLQTRLFWDLLQGVGLRDRLRALGRLDLRPQVMWTSHRKLAPEVTAEFLDWQGAVTGRPWFAFLNLYDAHLPYDPPPPWDTKFSSERSALDRYDGSIAYMDDALGALFAELRRRGVLDGTLVIVSSDHGEAFGEHGLHGHGNSLYRSELHVPLVVRYPARVAAGARVRAPVTLRDLAATVLDATGAPPGSRSLPGTSWLSILVPGGVAAGSAVVSEVSAGINTAPSDPVSRGPMKSLLTDSTHYIRNGDGVEEAYAWRVDGEEATNLAGRPAVRPILDAMRDAVARALR